MAHDDDGDVFLVDVEFSEQVHWTGTVRIKRSDVAEDLGCDGSEVTAADVADFVGSSNDWTDQDSARTTNEGAYELDVEKVTVRGAVS